MAIPRGHRFAIEFDSALPQGLVLIGDAAPDNEYQTREDKIADRPLLQEIVQVTGKRQRKATVTDSDEPHAKRASFKSVRVWEAAYRRYGHVFELTARASKGDLAAVREMASASGRWRQIAAATTLPWWMLVAVETAAAAFEAQAREYETREGNDSHDRG